MLKNKHIVLGVTGGIAAYKSCYLVREFKKAGADVKVIMTEAATKFVAPLTFSTLSEHEVAVDLWDKNQTTKSEIGTRHIDLATWADLFLVAPASAHTVAKMTYGLADNLLTVIALACRAPIVLAPTMDADMFLNESTQKNLAVLRERGFFVIPPAEGEHASGLHGPGRFPEIDTIVHSVDGILEKSYQDLKSVSVLVTAGPTYEPIDPVRFIGNRSSGKMGFALARAAAMRGAEVTLVSGPVGLETPRHVHRIDVETAEQMQRAVLEHAPEAKVVIMAAAVSDFKPEKPSSQKIKKDDAGNAPVVRLTRSADILKNLGQKRNGGVLVGFALETEHELENAREKLKKKNADLIILNSLNDEGAGIGTDTNIVTIIEAGGKEERLPRMSKFDVANSILDRVSARLQKN